MDDAPRESHFDPTWRAWILSSHADVVAALREPQLSAHGESSRAAPTNGNMRVSDTHAFSAERLAAWWNPMELAATRLMQRVPLDQPVDLMPAFAAPWSLEVAVLASGTAPPDATRLAALAHEVFVAAAQATGPGSRGDANAAVSELAHSLAGGHTPLAVQSFVAISQTLPCTLAGAWRLLFEHRDVLGQLRLNPALLPSAVEELLRLASPARVVFRRAGADVVVGAAHIAAGEQVVLNLWAANRDPVRFPEPQRLDLCRGAAGHVGLGRGVHPCAGALMVRTAVTVATAALLEAADEFEAAGAVSWLEGSSIRAPTSLPVVLRRDKAHARSRAT